MNKERLLKLADLLETDANNETGARFNLEVWGCAVNFNPENNFTPQVNCGTYACAVGLACISGAFSDEGLGYRMRSSNVIPILRVAEPPYEYTEWDAVRRFFGIIQPQADDLFVHSHYKITEGKEAELAVAERIRNFVAAGVIVL